jgi:threonine/homoserine/homoserine lactone efflux protein
VPVSAIGAFWAVSILFVITPGSDWAYAITAGLRHRTVVPAVSGLLLGHLVATLLVAAGLAALIAEAPALLPTLTVLGAAYLVRIGAGLLTSSSSGETFAVDSTSTSSVRQVAKGFGVSGLNPKVFLLFLALLPQFTDPDRAWPIAVQCTALGLVHVASCAVVYFAVGMGARTVLGARPGAAAAVTRFSGVAMIVIAAALMIEAVVG